MDWQSTLSWHNAKKRAKILQQIRLFFNEREVVEVETPTLSQGTITDLHLEALTCRYNFLSDNASSQSALFYLQTSPEFHMKRLLASGYGCIFQISKAFRHEEAGSHHNPEFTMLEWYRVGFDHFDLMQEVSALLKTILVCPEPNKVTYQSLFLDRVNIDPLNTNRVELLALIEYHQMSSDWLIIDSIDSSNDMLLQFIFSEIIEPSIGINAPCFVYNFPKSQASLAKLSITDERVAERFECYYQGVELVNGFHELTDSKIQIERFHEDNKNRIAKKLKKMPIDKHFINALSQGLPPCSGVALGVDRLVMLALNTDKIEQVITFPIERA